MREDLSHRIETGLVEAVPPIMRFYTLSFTIKALNLTYYGFKKELGTSSLILNINTNPCVVLNYPLSQHRCRQGQLH